MYYWWPTVIYLSQKNGGGGKYGGMKMNQRKDNKDRLPQTNKLLDA